MNESLTSEIIAEMTVPEMRSALLYLLGHSPEVARHIVAYARGLEICLNCGTEIRRSSPSSPWYHLATAQEQCGEHVTPDEWWEMVKSGFLLDPENIAVPTLKYAI